ncbi:MAG: site-specific DNA-methyltransferase, partial [Prevotellaceae bacterium]|nr:site-specific DNA-methyltransferase [Prevotellaceae bacterium]
MRMESVDMTAQNIERIGALFPNCITEMLDEERSTPEKKVYKKAINFDLLRQMLSGDVVEGDEAYEFTWVGKKAAIVEANKPIRKTLRPCKEDSVNWDTTENLYIEGDNLEVLKLLQESYLGKVKMIYIDPPYNTGHDFVYPDSFIMDNDEYNDGIGYFDEYGNVNFSRENSSSAGKYHSDWCSMIYSRLALARNFLSEDGVIFISIDDNELSNCKKICDEIFGTSNFMTCITRATGTPTGGGFDGLVNELDYILVYAKNSAFTHINGLPMDEESAKIYDQEDEYGRYLIRPLRRTGGEDRREDRPTMYFPIIAPDGTPVYPIGPTGYESRWICSPETAKRLEAEHLLAWKRVKRQGEEVWQVYQKFYLENRTKAPGNLWIDVEGNKKATRDIRSLFESNKVFDFPKPIGLLKKMIHIGSNSDSIIMDFFSGSGTTAQAIMEMNQEDGGSRRFILVQIPEKTPDGSEARKYGFSTISELGKERIRRVAAKIEESTSTTAVSSDTGFRVFKLDDSNMKDVYYAPTAYEQNLLDMMESNIKEDRTDLDLLFGCLLEWGLPLSMPYSSEKIGDCTVHTYNDGDLIACFDENIPDEVVKAI